MKNFKLTDKDENEIEPTRTDPSTGEIFDEADEVDEDDDDDEDDSDDDDEEDEEDVEE